MVLKRWKVTASRYLLRDQWLTVRADDCVTETGATLAPYYVLEYPDWAHAAEVWERLSGLCPRPGGHRKRDA